MVSSIKPAPVCALCVVDILFINRMGTWPKGVQHFFADSPNMMSIGTTKRGALIVFEGCDRVGKSTQCKKLVQTLVKSGRSAKEMHFPGIHFIYDIF